MNKIPFLDFMGRVLITRERVQFSHIDPYGHLNTSKYIEFFLNHRIHAAEEQLQCYTMDIVKELSIGFVVQDIQVRFSSPSFQSEILEIASWVSGKNESGFTLSLVMLSELKRKVKSSARVQFVSVDMKTGRSTNLPISLPTRSAESLIATRPMAEVYKTSVIGLPEDFI